MRSRSSVLLALAVAMTAALVAGLANPAHAVLALVSRNPDLTFLVHPGNGFPQWYQDANGLALGQCNFGVPGDPVGFVPDPNCLPAGASAKPLPNLPFDEAFYFSADATVAGGAIEDFSYSAHLEAAYATGDPAPGQQMVFTRIRMRGNVTVAPATYTVTHPYGVESFTVTAIDPGKPEINFTEDIGIAPLGFNEAVVNGNIGPFLTCVAPPPPAGYIGNLAGCTVTGSPNGTNFLDVNGVRTTSFLVGGRIDAKIPFTPLTIDAATYRCTRGGAACQIDVFAHSSPAAALFATSGGFTGPQMTGDGAGGFFGTLQVLQASIPFPPGPANPPLLVNVSATDPAGLPVAVKAPLVDAVIISQATHNLATGILTVRATSGDLRATLREAQFGTLVGGVLNTDLNGFFPISIPHPTVTVVSNAGGAVTAPVQIINVPESLKITGAVFNARRRRVTVTGTSSARGATIELRAGVNTIGTTVVNAKGGFKVVGRANRKPRRVLVASSGGKTVRALVR